MCGITGMWNLAGAPVDPALLVRMRDSLAHRGPDGAACVLFSTRDPSRATMFGSIEDLTGSAPAAQVNDVGFGHRRLSIIDLVSGDQPMSNADGSVWIVFNGEIYNYRELRQSLTTAGHRFRTASDTEVIIHAYEEYGQACALHLNGIFAFAIWDAPQRKLVLV